MATAQSHPSAPRVAGHFADAEQQYESAVFGMWLFLLTEVMLFGALFAAYAVYRYLHQENFAAASRHLDLWLGSVNTVILITSSFTMALAHRAAQRPHEERRQLVIFLALTALLGTAFLGIKAMEYREKFSEHLVPGSHFHWSELHDEGDNGDAHDHTAGSHSAAQPQAGSPTQPDTASIELFYSLYFVTTGLHAAHMVIGLGVLLALIGKAGFAKTRPVTVELAGLYWHFVDIVWIFLFPMVYLIGRHQ